MRSGCLRRRREMSRRGACCWQTTAPPTQQSPEPPTPHSVARDRYSRLRSGQWAKSHSVYLRLSMTWSENGKAGHIYRRPSQMKSLQPATVARALIAAVTVVVETMPAQQRRSINNVLRAAIVDGVVDAK